MRPPAGIYLGHVERVVPAATLHCAHRLPGKGHCRCVHGITWRVTLAVTTRPFSSDVHDRPDLRVALRRLLDECSPR